MIFSPVRPKGIFPRAATRVSMKPQTLLLIGESFSPWTKKARWALEHCGLAYDYKEYTPTLSELALRWRLQQWTGAISVPVLFSGREVLRGSWDIANYANETADGRLGDMEAISPWNDLSEAALAQARTRVVRSVLENDQALEEALPAFVPRSLRRSMRFVARDAARRLDRKYAHLVQPFALRQALERTREELARAKGDYLLGPFSYADIAMAVVLEVIAPIAHTEPPLGPVTTGFWNDPALAGEFQGLIDWRNRLAETPATTYSQFRTP